MRKFFFVLGVGMTLIGTSASAQCFKKIVAGQDFFLAISQDGTLWAWGENGSGQLGDGTTTDRTTPVQISTATTWAFIAAGDNHSAAIKTDGTLWTWGNDSYGQLGNGASGSVTSPLQIGSDTNWKEVAVGDRGSLAVKTNGTLWSWGGNTNYYLGNGQSTSYVSQVPVQVGSATDWNHIYGNALHGLAIKNSGTLWAWGYNNYGQLGIGSTTNSDVPVQVGTASDWKEIATGDQLSLALKNDNTLWAWGTSNSSNLNIGTAASPVQIGTASNWKTVSVKKYSTSSYALLTRADGTLWAWGNDTSQQLGNGAGTTNYSSPTQIGTNTNWANATAGYLQSSGIKTDNTFWVWGATSLVGNGTGETNSPTQYACTALNVIEQNASKDIKFYPNPATSKITVSGVKVSKVSVYDQSGRKYDLQTVNNEINVSKLTSGIYILVTETDKGTFSDKLIKN
ncbi:MAG: hypothetical protein DI529_05360 [Chryseobacterium sp.]|nr:MAG: hypothetical protein DI529_05360 [Chryseobacterium sp.]